MGRRVLSRGTPAVLSIAEQELLVRTADDDAEIRAALEHIVGRPWSELGFGQKVTLLSAELEKGRGLAALNAARRARRDLLNTVAEERGDESLADQLARLTESNQELQNQLSARDQELARLQQAYAAIPPRGGTATP